MNWNALDELVLDYAQAEHLLFESDAQHIRDFEVRCTINHIRRLIEEGCITEALDLIQQHAPTVINDQWLLFQLHKQKFIELLRSGSADAQAQAIQCSRTDLGPCALNAYPEAYEEFKRLLLALIYDKDDDGSPVAVEWSESRRTELAATVASVLKAQLHGYEPLFALALRYLVSTHNSFCFRRGVASPIAHIANTVLVKEKDPPAVLHDGLVEAPNFSESEVQALAHAVGVSRQGAVDSLRYTGGDLIAALKNELSRIRLDTGVLDELVCEYCVYRGLIDCNTHSGACTDTQSTIIVPEMSDEIGSSTRDGPQETMTISIPMDTQTEGATADDPKLAAEYSGQASVAQFEREADIDIRPWADERAIGEHLTSFEEHRAADETIIADSGVASESLCSTSGPVLSGGSVTVEQKHKTVRQKVQLNAPPKRWKGRVCSQGGTENGHSVLNLSCRRRKNHEVKVFMEEEKHLDIEKYGVVLEIRELACQGMFDEVVQEVKRMNPQFFEYNPHLLFHLKQAEFLKLVETGNYAEALRVARSDMGPLAAKYRDLLKSLKETVLALARPQEETLVKPTSPSMLAGVLQVALGASLGITEPLLMKIIRATLHTHTEWFKLQMCPDSFAEILKINNLKETEAISLGSSCRGMHLETNNAISSQVTTSTTSTSGSLTQQPDSSRDGAHFDDRSILTVMEWMALPRGDAIQLLAQYNGNIDSVFEHMLS